MQGKTRCLKKIPLNSIFSVNDAFDSGYNLENIANEVETLMKQCPRLTQLKCHLSRGSIPTEQFVRLIGHYSNQLGLVQCKVTDTIAEQISNHCANLKELIVSGQPELSNKGLMSFCKLTKLKTLHLIIDDLSLTRGVMKLLGTCIANLKNLPWYYHGIIIMKLKFTP